MAALLSKCKPAIRVVEKIDSRRSAPRLTVEARIQRAFKTRREKDTYIACLAIGISCTRVLKGKKLKKKLHSLGQMALGH